MVRKNIKNTIRKHNLINKDEHIVIGLSGGPDSVCLFSVLQQLSSEMNFTLHAVHVNHGFRPGAAEEDQAYVEELCRVMGVECTSFVHDCNAVAQAEGLSSEEAGRKVRYGAFIETAEMLMARGIPAEKIKIAVAQNADDQAETVLFRLLRGTGTDGLAGMAYSRMEKNIMVIRPLLDTWRTDIESYCTEHDLAPRIDHTNLQPVYTRNKIRLELIPYLQEKFNENIKETLGRLSRIAAEDKEYLWQCAEEKYKELETSPGVLDQQGLAELAPAVRHRVIMKALQELGMEQDLTAAHLESIGRILDASGESRTVELPDGYRVTVRYGEAAFYRVTENSNCSMVLKSELLSAEEYIPAGGEQTAAFDYVKIMELHGGAQVVLRNRKEGDFLSIKGGGRKKIQNLFVDMKVPKEQRDNVLIAAAGSEVLWIPAQPEKGIVKGRYSHRCKLEQDTKKVLKLEILCDM